MKIVRFLLLITLSFLLIFPLTPSTVSADFFEDDDHEEHEKRPDGKRDTDKDESPYEELFKNLSKLGVVLGAVSLSWFLMKRKMKSASETVRKMGKWFYKWHEYTGWAAVVLISVHGTYFVLTEWGDDETITGLIAAGMMLVLALWGLLLRTERTAQNRKVHRILAFIWVGLTILHAEDAIPLLLLVCGGSFVAIWYFERRMLPSAGNDR